MTNNIEHWSYEDDIPDGTDWEEILSDLRWLARRYAIQSGYRFQMLELMMLEKDSDKHNSYHDNMLQIAIEGKESSKPLSNYLDRINEYILRRREKRVKGETDT